MWTSRRGRDKVAGRDGGRVDEVWRAGREREMAMGGVRWPLKSPPESVDQTVAQATPGGNPDARPLTCPPAGLIADAHLRAREIALFPMLEI